MTILQPLVDEDSYNILWDEPDDTEVTELSEDLTTSTDNMDADTNVRNVNPCKIHCLVWFYLPPFSCSEGSGTENCIAACQSILNVSLFRVF